MLVQEQDGSITCSSGTGFANLRYHQNQIFTLCIEPADPAVQYDIKLINTKGFTIWDIENITGDYGERLAIPVRNNATLQIENASDPTAEFTYYLSSIERYG